MFYNVRFREQFDPSYVCDALKNNDCSSSGPESLTRSAILGFSQFQDGIDNKLIYITAMRKYHSFGICFLQHLSGRVPINLLNPGISISSDFLGSQDEICTIECMKWGDTVQSMCPDLMCSVCRQNLRLSCRRGYSLVFALYLHF